MNERWRATFQLWGETDEHKARVREAKRIIEQADEKYSNYYVAYSGGKDSIPLLHLTLQVKPDVDVFHWDHGPWLMPRQIEGEVLNIAVKLGVKRGHLFVRRSPKGQKEDVRTHPGPFYQAMKWTVPLLCKKKGWQAVLLGSRSEESTARRARLRERQWHWGAWVEAPLKNWSWKDSWAYVICNDLPYPSFYDKYAEVIGYDKVRLVTFFDYEFERFGSPYLDGVLMPKNKSDRG